MCFLFTRITFMITNVSTSDDGQYQVQAANGIGSIATRTISVFVAGNNAP